MKLQAVTVCINYADYLECILANRTHFDRWIIMTVPDDRETIALCERHGLEYRLSETLESDGRNFHATLYKSSVLNEGLESLDGEGWALILDADVRLPRNFRERLNALALQSGVLYGAAGRRICEDREMYEMLVACEPWDRFCARYSGVIGFFQLFDLEHSRNRYLPSNPPGQGPGDDDQFQLNFPPEMRRMLPMTVIHVGKSYVNWGGRTVGRFDVLPPAEAEDDEVMGALFRGRVALAGYYPGMRVKAWLGQCERVDMVDHFQVHQSCGDPVVEADRVVLRELWARETAGLARLHRLGPHCASSLAQIPDGSLDLLHLPGEATPGWLGAALPHWLRKLRAGGVVCGDLFGLPHWPDSTYAISLLLGVPDRVWASGFWCKRIDGKEPALDWLGKSTQAMERERGVVFAIFGSEELGKLLVSLHALRRHWGGPVTVFQWGEEDQSLGIACVRCGVELCLVGAASALPGGRESGGWMAEVIWMSPYERTLVLPAGTVVTAAIDGIFDEEGKAAETGKSGPLLAVRAERVSRRYAVPFSTAVNFAAGDATRNSALLLCDGASEKWTNEAWEVWCDAEATMTAAFAARVRVGAQTSIVTCVDEKSVADFERNWLTWNFGPDVPVLLFLIGIKEADFWLGGSRQPTAVICISADKLPRKLTEVIETEFFVLLPPTASPMPGAELFLSPVWNDSDVVLHEASAELDPAMLCGRIRTTMFRSLITDGPIPNCPRDGLSSLLQSAADRVGPGLRAVDVSRWGWKGLPALAQDTTSPESPLPVTALPLAS